MSDPVAIELAVLLVAVAVALRLLPRLIWPRLAGTDTWFHLLYVDLIRAHGHRVPPRHPRVLGPGRYTYPAGFHWLLSFLGPRAVGWLDRFGGVLFDLVTAGALTALLVAQGILPLGWGLVAAGLYLLLPGLVLFHIGPRAFSLTPRIAAQMLFALALAVLIAGGDAALVPGPVAGTIIAAALLAAMLLTSKFALQHLLFVAPAAAAVTGSWSLAVATAGAFPLAWLLSGGFFATQLRGQWDHLHWYLRLNQEMIAHRANWRRVGSALRRFDLPQLVVEAFWHNPILSGLTRHFPLFVALGWAVSSAAPGDGLPFWLTAFALIPWVLTAFGVFRIIGESERYLEFAAPGAWLLLWQQAPAVDRPWLAAVLGAVSLLAYAINLKVLARAERAFAVDDAREMVEALRREGDRVLLCLHMPESQLFLNDTQVRLAGLNGTLSMRDEIGEFLQWFLWRYPYVDPEHLDEIVARYGVDLVLEKRAASERLRGLAGRSYDLGGFAPVAENATWRLYRRRHGGEGS